jgi:hypothetical protein
LTDKPDNDPPRSRNVKLTDAEWAALERIALAYGLEWGGLPSRSEAVRLLIREWLSLNPAGPPGPPPSGGRSAPAVCYKPS